MTIETLEQYRPMLSNIKALEDEIQSCYFPISSPNGKENIGAGASSVRVPGRPTEEAFDRITDLKNVLIERQEEHQRILFEIEQWLRAINNVEIESIIRWRYLIGKTWSETNLKVYGYADREYCRKRFYRFKRENPDLFL